MNMFGIDPSLIAAFTSDDKNKKVNALRKVIDKEAVKSLFTEFDSNDFYLIGNTPEPTVFKIKIEDINKAVEDGVIVQEKIEVGDVSDNVLPVKEFFIQLIAEFL